MAHCQQREHSCLPSPTLRPIPVSRVRVDRSGEKPRDDDQFGAG